MTREFKDTDIEDEIREAFRVFDREGNGFISSVDLAEVMQSVGDVLSEEETLVRLSTNHMCMFTGDGGTGRYGRRWKCQL